MENQDEDSKLLKTMQNLELDSESVSIKIDKDDVQLWKDFLEYRKNRKEWDAWRNKDWKEHHPPHTHTIFNDFPVLTTDRLQLRLLRENDVEDAFRVLSNPTAMKYFGTRAHKDLRYTKEQYIEIMLSRHKMRDAIPWTITLKGEDKYIGHISATQFDKLFKFVEIAYIVDPAYWGRGIATEAVARAVRFLVEELKIHKIRASLFVNNMASRRVLDKVGFVQEGYLLDNAFIEGEFEDEYVMAFIAED